MSLVWYIAVMALTTYLIRMLPFTLFRRQIRSRYIRSLLYYLPYAVLSAMTLPAILYATGDIRTAAAGTGIALVLAYKGLPLIVVALAAAAVALLTGFLL
ncbi:MAG: AzlD domain-containing protein [Ruminococcaceae bacterium]|nr:AzlD domain-containing protein [Oscillospiraceae bacterium]